MLPTIILMLKTTKPTGGSCETSYLGVPDFFLRNHCFITSFPLGSPPLLGPPYGAHHAGPPRGGRETNIGLLPPCRALVGSAGWLRLSARLRLRLSARLRLRLSAGFWAWLSAGFRFDLASCFHLLRFWLDLI